MSEVMNVPVGSVIRYRYRGAWEYARIVEIAESHVKAINPFAKFDSDLPVGTRVFQGVWVGPNRETFEARRTYVTK